MLLCSGNQIVIHMEKKLKIQIVHAKKNHVDMSNIIKLRNGFHCDN